MPNYFGFAGEIQMECQHPKTSEAKAILILKGLMSRLWIRRAHHKKLRHNPNGAM